MLFPTAVMEIFFVLFWNSGFVGAEYGLPYTGPFTQLFWRYLALTLILFGYLTFRKRLQWPGWHIVAPTFFIGILAHGVWLSCSLISIQYGVPAGVVALTVALQPMVTGALSGRVVGEPTPVYRWIGMAIGFGGVALAVLFRVDFNDHTSVFFHFIPLGAVGAMTAATLIQRRMEVISHSRILPVDLSLFYQSLACVPVLFFPALLVEGFDARWTPAFIGATAWLVLAVSLTAYVLMFKLIKVIDATRLASLFYLGPPVTMVMAWAVLGDKLIITDMFGLTIAGIGVIIAELQLNNNEGTSPRHTDAPSDK